MSDLALSPGLHKQYRSLTARHECDGRRHQQSPLQPRDYARR
jgi:hypothetical protein